LFAAGADMEAIAIISLIAYVNAVVQHRPRTARRGKSLRARE
jgi:hypothetical protein